MNDVPVLDKEMSTTGKNLSDSIVEKYAFVFQSCDVNMKLLVENKVSHYPASDVLLKKARFLYRNQEIGWIEALADRRSRSARSACCSACFSRRLATSETSSLSSTCNNWAHSLI